MPDSPPRPQPASAATRRVRLRGVRPVWLLAYFWSSAVLLWPERILEVLERLDKLEAVQRLLGALPYVSGG